MIVIHFEAVERVGKEAICMKEVVLHNIKNKLRGLSLRADYTIRSTTAFRRS
jgi:hypothetical protein